MTRKELIDALLNDHMDDSVYAVLYDNDGIGKYFLVEDIATKDASKRLGKFTICPTLVLREDMEDM